MSYLPRFTARADRDLLALPEKIATACVEFVLGPLSTDPRRLGKPLRDHLAGKHSARRGQYRVVYTIDNEASEIVIEHIEHRRRVYR
jgi:mRNA interferase RelE/StbE